MYQNIEEYIHSHRQQMDVEVPDDAVWEKIDHVLDQKSRNLWERYPWLKVAAAVLLFAVALGVVMKTSRNGNTQGIVADMPDVELPITAEAWKDAEAKYESRIEVLMKQIQQVSIADDPQALEYNQQIESVNADLNKQRMLIDATTYQPSQGKRMLELYEQKILILNKMTDHLLKPAE